MKIERLIKLYEVAKEVSTYPIISRQDVNITTRASDCVCFDIWIDKQEHSYCACLGGWYELVTGEKLEYGYRSFAEYFGIAFDQSKELFGGELSMDERLLRLEFIVRQKQREAA